MEPRPWSAKLPFSYILNVWESGTQAQDLHISSFCSLPYQTTMHGIIMTSWHHDIMTSLDLWSKKKHLSKAGCNYGLLPNPRHLLHPKRKKYSDSGIDLWSRNQVNSATGTMYHRLSIEARICSKSMRELVYKQNWQEFWMKVNQNDTSLQRHTMPC